MFNYFLTWIKFRKNFNYINNSSYQNLAGIDDYNGEGTRGHFGFIQ